MPMSGGCNGWVEPKDRVYPTIKEESVDAKIRVTPQKIKDNKNLLMVGDFTSYCLKHPEERFWQALSNWSGRYIYSSTLPLASVAPELWDLKDTFPWDGKNEMDRTIVNLNEEKKNNG